MRGLRSAAAPKSDRAGVLAVVQDQPMADRLQGLMHELQLDDELVISETLDAALRRIRSGYAPRVLLLDLADSAAPIAEVNSARTVGGADLKLVALGILNDVTLFRDLLAAGANDYLVKPATRETLSAALEKGSTNTGTGTSGGLGQVIVFVGSRGGVGTTTTAVSCAWLLAEERKERVALVDLDLHFGTIALKLDTDPGSGLCEALEQPSRIDSLFIERAIVKGDRQFAGVGRRGVRGAASDRRRRRGRHAALRAASKIRPDRRRSAARRKPDTARRARRGKPRCYRVRAQSRGPA